MTMIEEAWTREDDVLETKADFWQEMTARTAFLFGLAVAASLSSSIALMLVIAFMLRRA